MDYQTSLNAPRVNDFKGFQEKAREIGDKILELEDPLIIHHYDCDGLASGGLVCLGRRIVGKQFKRLAVKNVRDEQIALLPESKAYVFVDLGSSYAKALRTGLKGEIIVIDHHPPVKEEGVEQLNPHFYGIDGSTDCSASTAAAFCFKHLNNEKIYQLGIVGAVGDMQDSRQEGFVGLNKLLANEAEEKGKVLIKKDLRLFGKISRPLTQFLTFCTEPILPGLTGKAKKCAAFLENNNIPLKKDEKWLTYYDLEEEDKKTFVSALINYALEKKVPEKLVKQMVGFVYYFPWEEARILKEASEFSTLLNACGRHGKDEAGINACLHEGELKDAEATLLIHRKQISMGLSFAQDNTMDLGAFYFLDARNSINDTVIGSIAGAFLGSGAVTANKPIIAFSFDEEGNTKASSRGNSELVSKGLDLGKVMNIAGSSVNGIGGGHKPAAGCVFKTSKENDEAFLKKAREEIKTQLNSSS
ncbi:MAG: DHH family phosphoesterase [Candidatus Micrarchaeota archaeon]